MTVKAQDAPKVADAAARVKKVVEFAKHYATTNPKHPYMWGGKGEPLTKETVERFKKRYANDSNANYQPVEPNGKFHSAVGRSGYRSYDCSGLTRDAFLQVGIDIKEGSGNQGGFGRQFDSKDAKAGDLLWRKGHVGIVDLDDRTMIEARGSQYGIEATRKKTDMPKAIRVIGGAGSITPQGGGGGGGGFSVDAAVAQNKKFGYSTAKWKHIQSVVGASADGIPGPATARAVADFQGKHQLGVDGMAGPKTWEKVISIKPFGNASSGNTTKPPAQTTPTPSVSINVNAAVAQNKKFGYSTSKWKHIQSVVGATADGVPGPLTARAVANFQAKHKLGVDGMAGPQTWAKVTSIKPFGNTTAPKPPAQTTPSTSTKINVNAAVAQNKRFGYSSTKWKHIQKHVGTTADGSPGPNTAQAVANFQAKHRLTVDGMAGNATCNKIASIAPFPKEPQIAPGAWTWPAQSRRVTSAYGNRIHPISKKQSFHTGIDISRDGGTRIMAAKGGRVTFRAASGGYGNLMKIDHGNGVETRYAHLASYKVGNNAQVKSGQEIAVMGTTGQSTGVHLHFEVRVNGNHRNPRNYV